MSGEFYEEQAFLIFFLLVYLAIILLEDISISPTRYFDQRLLNFNNYFSSHVDYIFFVKSVYKQQHLRSSIDLDMPKIKPGTLTVGVVRNNLKGRIERFVASDVLAMIKKLGTPTYFLTFSCADQRLEKLTHIIKKLKNLDLMRRN